MKKGQALPLIVAILVHTNIIAQNAHSYFFDTSYGGVGQKAGSFLIDSGSSGNRGIIFWSRLPLTDSTSVLSLDEYSINGDFISRRIIRDVLPFVVRFDWNFGTKIIKSRFSDGYYLMARHLSPGPGTPFSINVNPIIIKTDRHLNPIWMKRILSIVDKNHFFTLNTMIEASNGDLVMLGYGNPGCLVFRMSSTGAPVWSTTYTTEEGSHDFRPKSLVETTNKDICITGTLVNDPSYNLTDELLFLKIRENGTAILLKTLDLNGAIQGVKIVRYKDDHEKNRFFICGDLHLIREPRSLPIDQQILVTDIDENGLVASSWSVGEYCDDLPHDVFCRNDDQVSDFIFEQTSDNAYSLHLTGKTSSFGYNTYYMQLKYGYNSLALGEFSTFPIPMPAYNKSDGVEIKRAGASKFAILGNSQKYSYSPVTGSRYTPLASIFIRDLEDNSESCIRKHSVPVDQLIVNVKTYGPKTSFNTPFVADWNDIQHWNGYSSPLCGDFTVDPYTAAIDPLNPDRMTIKARRSNSSARELPANRVSIFPNPVNDVVNVRSDELIQSASIIDMSGKTTQIISVNVNTNNLHLSTHALPAGIYYIKLIRKSGVSLHKILVR